MSNVGNDIAELTDKCNDNHDVIRLPENNVNSDGGLLERGVVNAAVACATETTHDDGVIADRDTGDDDQQSETMTSSNLSKSALKKLKRLEWRDKKKREARPAERERLKERARERTKREEEELGEERLTKRQKLAEKRSRQKTALETGTNLAIDCSMEGLMSEKELTSLVLQIGRCYGANSKSRLPFHLHVINLPPTGRTHKLCEAKLNGFSQLRMSVSHLDCPQLFESDKVVYLTPDSPKVLESLDPDRVYVIGGLVDDSVIQKTTLGKAESLGLATARLPIDKFMTKAASGSYKRVLTINQVFEILLDYNEFRDWTSAFEKFIPKRFGFVKKL